MLYSTDLTNSQWQAIKFLLPAKIWQRKRKHSIRAIINAILYVVKGGISWRLMPNDLPDWRLVYYYFCRWSKQGLVQQIHDKLVTKVRLQAGREVSPSLGLMDSQSVKTMSVTTLKGYDGNKKLTGRKRFIIVDVLGLVLALRLTSANVGERAGALLLFTALGQRFTRLKTILADQGFDGPGRRCGQLSSHRQSNLLPDSGCGLWRVGHKRLPGGAQPLDCRANIWVVGLPSSTSQRLRSQGVSC